MPVVRRAGELECTQHDGWTETLCAGAGVFGVAVPLRARRVVVDAGVTARLDTYADEAMVYVVRGSGAVEVHGERHRLLPETVVWLDGPGDLLLEAGSAPAPGGLEVLVTEAPQS